MKDVLPQRRKRLNQMLKRVCIAIGVTFLFCHPELDSGSVFWVREFWCQSPSRRGSSLIQRTSHPEDVLCGNVCVDHCGLEVPMTQ